MAITVKIGKARCAFDHKYSEIMLSECAHGCKVYKCSSCGHEKVLHNTSYGCKEA